MAGAFRSDIATLRKRAREHIAQGAVTPGYQLGGAPDFSPDGPANLREDLGRH